jgi:hypothetical protein
MVRTQACLALASRNEALDVPVEYYAHSAASSSGPAVVPAAIPSVLRRFMLHNVATLCIKGKDSVNEEDANEGSRGAENANDQNQG